MGNSTIFILLVCIVAPLLMLLFVTQKETRTVTIFLISGMVICYVTAFMERMITYDNQIFFTVNISPVIEEIFKAILILFFALRFKPSNQHLLQCAAAMGVGFAVMENAYIVVNVIHNVNVLWAFIRGFGTGLMHVVCTSMVGYGMSFVHSKKKLFVTGTLALLTLAIVFHSIYNNIIQSRFQWYGIFLPLVVYVPIAIANKKIFNTKDREK